MPNEKVRYFKPPEEIKDKIVYVKDKDLIGFDSASSVVFQFNLWRMKKYGMTENFILMDDDYFIGKPLNKSNFFYEENGKVYPSLVTRDFYEIDKNKIKNTLESLIKKIDTLAPHGSNGFNIMQKATLFLLYDIFGDDDTRNGRPLIEPSFTHNAIPLKQSDVKEVYDMILKYYLYIDQTLKSKEREIRSLQPQTLFMAYARNMYDRRVKMITSSFFDLTQFKGKVNDQLFVINVSIRNYPNYYFINEKKYLEKLYPQKSPYEIGGPYINKSLIKDHEYIEDKDYFKDLIDYLDRKLNEKNKIKNDIIEINSKINVLSEKYDKFEKELESLTKIINNNRAKNITLNVKSNDQISLNTKYIHILIILIILIIFLLYLYKNGYLKPNTINNEVNYMDINSLNNLKNENEMFLMNSKIDL